MGNFTMAASFAKNQFQSLSVTGTDLNSAGGDKVGDATGRVRVHLVQLLRGERPHERMHLVHDQQRPG